MDDTFARPHLFFSDPSQWSYDSDGPVGHSGGKNNENEGLTVSFRLHLHPAETLEIH